MKMIKCDNCKEVTSEYGDDRKVMHKLRIIMDNNNYGMVNLDICSDCFKKHNISELLEKGTEEPDTLIESLRDMIREEIDNARDQ